MKKNIVNIINHNILLDEININFLDQKENFVTFGIVHETNSLVIKQENTIPEIFTQYVIKFDELDEKTVSCENDFYTINLKNIDIFKKHLPLKCLNTYKINEEHISFIHVINFIFKNDLIDSIYFPFNNSTKQKKISC